VHNQFDIGSQLPTLSGARVALRWLTEADVPSLYSVFSDPLVCRYWSFTPWTDLAQARKYLTDIQDYFHAQTLFQWGIVRLEDDLVMGTCTLAYIDQANRRTELGYALSSSHWGNGYMREAVPLALSFAFESLGMHRVEADVDPRNDPSIRLLEELGFQREGYLRERYRVGEEIQDAIFYGLLEPEWKGGAISR